MNLEDDLRTTLLDRAERPAPHPDLLSAVTAGIHRNRRRRRALAAVAVVAVAAAAGTPLVLRHHPAPRPGPAATASVTPARPVYEAPTFPLRPGYLPAGIDASYGSVVTQLGPNLRLENSSGDADVLSIEEGPIRPDPETETPDSTTTVIQDRPASLHVTGHYDGARHGDTYVFVQWQRTDGTWVTVQSWGPRDSGTVRSIAQHLTGGARIPAVPTPFSLPFAPPGLILQYLGADQMCLATPDKAARERNPTGLCVTMQQGAFDPDGATDTWKVNGRRVAYLPDAASLIIEWGGDTQIEVGWDPQDIPLTHDQVVELSEGLYPTR
ncbi:hypothetical protein ACWT_4086 [Actinoplanes sp. SE50]|uniref:hypothetical protein n=1 Tax=unclassified Actinoplanes TaxID=2626549 RepID=UPI00023EBD70|nr:MULTISPECIES: hypothetical protein [unclassified Actinoplanes]AEV85110.1 hypothetical protein ACPL_4215 [Actinoplanes sp. SE50/110]ATO83501.1 hypothetical protein ACWT_4086 [Actinoplanes sp. SE50]SLM00908.1 hypothetical protein ACSP50_4141 [Actinoplanes sp. SE50/110]